MAATSVSQGDTTQEDERLVEAVMNQANWYIERSVKCLCQLLDLTAACKVCVLCVLAEGQTIRK